MNGENKKTNTTYQLFRHDNNYQVVPTATLMKEPERKNFCENFNPNKYDSEKKNLTLKNIYLNCTQNEKLAIENKAYIDCIPKQNYTQVISLPHTPACNFLSDLQSYR